MANKKRHITKENIGEWLHSTGFLLPRNALELARFEKLYDDFEYELSGEDIDPLEIWNESDSKEHQLIPEKIDVEIVKSWKMVARNMGTVPQAIYDKMRENELKASNNVE